MNTFSYLKAGFIAVLIGMVFVQTVRVSGLQTQNQELEAKVISQGSGFYQGVTDQDFLVRLKTFENRDTAFSETKITRDVNHWVPGKTKTDTVTTKYEVHISVTEDSK